MHPEAVTFLADTNKVRGFLYACANSIKYRRTGVIDADDLVQDGYIAILSVAPSWVPTEKNRNAKFSSFAYSVARHAMLKAIPGMYENVKRRWYYKTRAEKEGADLPMEMNGFTESMATVGVSDERMRRRLAMVDAMAELRKLPPRDAKMVIDRFYYGKSQAEIGARYGLSQNTVSKILRRSIGRNAGRAQCDDPKSRRTSFISRTAKSPMRMTVVEAERPS